MTFTAPTDTVVSVLTTQGRDLLARSIMGQVSIQLVGFKVGRAGYDVTNPVKLDPANPVDPAKTDLDDPIFPLPTTSTKPFTAVERPANNVVAAVCRLDRGEATYGLGELGVWARVVRSTGAATAIYTAGQDYMVAVAHFPLTSKTDRQVYVFRLIVAV